MVGFLLRIWSGKSLAHHSIITGHSLDVRIKTCHLAPTLSESMIIMKIAPKLPVIKTVMTVAAAMTLTVFAQAQSLIRDAEIEEMLSDFSSPIISAAGLNPEVVDIFIVNDQSLNAFVTRGQNMFFHTGLINESETPNQLKGVIAHEVGHIAGGHIVRSDEGTKNAQVAALIAAGIGIAAILAGEGSAGALILAGAPQQFGALQVAAYSRVNEAAADQFAANYLEATEQSSEGLIHFFEKFRYQEVLSQARRFPYFRGHPLSSDRIDSLREVTEESPYYRKKDDDESIYRLRMAQAKLHGFLDAPQIVFSNFPPDDKSDFALYARSVAYYRAADLKNAIVEVDELIKRQPENPYFHELKAQILFESGKWEASLPSAEEALALKDDSALLETALARSLTNSDETADLNRAVDLYKSALQKEPNNGFAWYNLAIAYGKLDQEPLAKYATAEQAYHVGNLQRAQSFARRAQADLPRQSPQWRRASDIIAIAQSELAKSRRNRRRPKL